MDERLDPSLPQDRTFFRGITLNTLATKGLQFTTYQSHPTQNREKILGKIRTVFEDNAPQPHIVGGRIKNLERNTTVRRFPQGIWFLIQRKGGASTTCVWSPKRTCHCYNNALQKHEINGLPTLTLFLEYCKEIH